MANSKLFSREVEFTDQASIESADFQTTSDTIDPLTLTNARAQDRTTPEEQQARGASVLQKINSPYMDDIFQYKPVQDGLITPDMVYHLFSM